MAEPRWYCLATDGQATLCVDRDDAVETAGDADVAWPRIAPHRAVQLVAVEDLDRLREALRWNAGALQACCSGGIREASNITIADETKSFSEILDMADAALAQEQP